MAGLFESLSSATSGLTAARLGMDVAGQNLANVNTPGYSRRTLHLADVPPAAPLSAGRGVSVEAVRAERDRFVLSRLHREQQGAGFDEAVVAGLQELEGAVGQSGSSLDARLAAFFNAFAALANDATSPSARDQVVREAQDLASALQSMAGRVADARRNADTQLGGAIAEVNTLAAEIARLNDRISASGTDVDSLIDRRDEAIARLSALANVHVLTTSDGTVDITIGQGRPLIVGVKTYALAATPGGANGFAAVTSEGLDLTSEITGGRIGGLIALRDEKIPAYAARLDTLAFDLASEVNALATSGFDANGDAGVALFTLPATSDGAAANIAVSAAVAANSRLVTASSTGAAGDNQVARAMAALRDARVVNGDTATALESWAAFVYSVGSDVSSARASQDSREQVVRQLERLRDQVSAVSLDEEAANLMRYQRAYQANARYFTTIVDTLDVLMDMVR